VCEAGAIRTDERDLRLLDDVDVGLKGRAQKGGSRPSAVADNQAMESQLASPAISTESPQSSTCDPCSMEHAALPEEVSSNDIDVLRAALIRESNERRRAECSAGMQTEIVTLALDLLVREPDINGYFGALTKTVVEESESHTCAVWLLDDDEQHCDLWMAYVKDRLVIPLKGAPATPCGGGAPFPCESLATHLFEHKAGWATTVEYGGHTDVRLPERVREFADGMNWGGIIAAPLLLGGRTLGWMTVSYLTPSVQEESRWWRVMLIEAIVRQATLALHHSRVIDANRAEERRKAILEERNRLARDIHDKLAQGFAAILMQLQATQREASITAPDVSAKIETAIDIARTHLTEARRSVGTLRPNVGSGEDVARALKRIADLVQRTTTVPIEISVEELPRFGDGVEQEIVGIAQEALANAVRHSRAQRIRISASPVRSIGVRLSVADDGRGIPRERASAGFGMTSMQERAERIGASLTIVTAPRSGTEVVLAWEPSALPTQVHVAS
jgi:signal transduction histidine kinase